MKLSYPVTIKNYSGGQVGLFCVDVPEAVTAGNTLQEAIHNAEDALVVALSSYTDQQRDIPVPSKPLSDQQVVSVPPLASMKLAIYQAMRIQGITWRQLSEQIGYNERQIRQILDITYESKISHIEATLSALSLRVAVDVEPIPDTFFCSGVSV